MTKTVNCYICSNRQAEGSAYVLEYEGFDRDICSRCVEEHPELFDDCNTREGDGVVTLPAEQVAAIDRQTELYVQARMTGRPVSFRYVDGTHETFNA